MVPVVILVVMMLVVLVKLVAVTWQSFGFCSRDGSRLGDGESDEGDECR